MNLVEVKSRNTGTCEHHETAGSIKDKFLHRLRKYQLPNKNSALRN